MKTLTPAFSQFLLHAQHLCFQEWDKKKKRKWNFEVWKVIYCITENFSFLHSMNFPFFLYLSIPIAKSSHTACNNFPLISALFICQLHCCPGPFLPLIWWFATQLCFGDSFLQLSCGRFPFTGFYVFSLSLDAKSTPSRSCLRKRTWEVFFCFCFLKHCLS